MNDHAETRQSWRAHLPLIAVAVAASLIGVYVRFKGLGAWSLGIDEYYTARSVENILRAGLPEYECGGYYLRGLLMVYPAALLQWLGLSPELSLRLIAASSSLLALPAAFLIGSRVHGRAVGWLAVTILALSVWEIEMARFARMYAPFQAVFLWYVVFFLKYTVERQTRALWPMIILSVVGILVWEGGFFLGLANLLPPFLNHSSARLSRPDWRYLAGTGLLAILLYVFATNKLRTLGSDDFLPADYVFNDFNPPIEMQLASPSFWDTLMSHPIWLALALGPLILVALALRWIATFRPRPLTALALLVALAAGLLHQFALLASIVLLLLLLRMLSWRELFSRSAWPFGAAVLACAVFWISYELTMVDWQSAEQAGWRQAAMALLYPLASFPDVALEIVLPWSRAVPGLALALALLIAFECIRVIVRDEPASAVERVILVILICMLLAASASDPPRHETRYVFFLYPLAIVIALTAIARGVCWGLRRVAQNTRHATLAIALVALGAFALSEDFQPHHLRHIDSEATHFRVGMPPGLASHYYPRSNVRAAAQWLSQHARPEDLIVNSYQSLEFYYPATDFFFMDWRDRRFRGWSCRGGTVERWDNKPLLYTIPALQTQFARARRAFYVSDSRELDDTLPHFGKWRPRVVGQYGKIVILSLSGGAD